MEKVKSEVCTKSCCCDIANLASDWEKADVRIIIKVDGLVIVRILIVIRIINGDYRCQCAYLVIDSN